jgi:hypothetical protein
MDLCKTRHRPLGHLDDDHMEIQNRERMADVQKMLDAADHREPIRMIKSDVGTLVSRPRDLCINGASRRMRWALIGAMLKPSASESFSLHGCRAFSDRRHCADDSRQHRA